MLTVKKTTDWQRVIEACFAGDSELIEKYHVCAPCTLKEASNNTFNVLKSGNVHPDFQMYKLMIGSELIGFSGTEMNDTFLTTFCIKKEHRNKAVMEDFWRVLDGYISDPCRTALYTRNSRAIGFIKDNGGEEVTRFHLNGEEAVLLEF
jgi:hypothetical protein